MEQPYEEVKVSIPEVVQKPIPVAVEAPKVMPATVDEDGFQIQESRGQKKDRKIQEVTNQVYQQAANVGKGRGRGRGKGAQVTFTPQKFQPPRLQQQKNMPS